tara:strand:+ start:1148 stop:1897 length:750 start_codon:yes stop_codon:yes gene_type:complete
LKISIITVCYNSQKTISETIESVIRQKHLDKEYIIIDGGSSDNTLSIIKKYQNHIDKLISEKDNGIYDAINKGLKQANGDIIGLLHSDDHYPNDNVLSTVSQSFENNNVDIVWGNVALINENNNKKRFYSGKSIDVSSFDVGVMPPHPSVFIKRTCYQKFGNFNLNYKIAADYDLLLRFLKIERLNYLYNSNILINMRLGGLSNSGIVSLYKINKEIYKIHKAHMIPISIFGFLKKIPLRIKELINKNG